jgi:hypothetical protein
MLNPRQLPRTRACSCTGSLTFSKGLQTSIDSAKSLAGLKGMLSNAACTFNSREIAKANR